MSTEETYLDRALYRLDHCATNDAAHFGGPHGMFVDVPVRDLQALITQLRLLQGALREITKVKLRGSDDRWMAAQRCIAIAEAALAKRQQAPLVSGPIFTVGELDAAAEKMAGGAMYECPDRIHDFLTEAQAAGLRSDLRAAIKTSLLFDLMNHLEPEA